MPNIHGLAALVGLVFAPCAEFRTDNNKDRYTGAIIGLGPDPHTGEALLPDHDIEVIFDFAFVQEDLVKVCVFPFAFIFFLSVFCCVQREC
jgi:ATP-dependent RNA helicase TDRD9